GPVLIDIPDNLQREEIDPDELESFVSEPENKDISKLNEQVERCIQLLENAKRPVIILGWGIALAKAQDEAKEFVDKIGFPVLPSWAMMYLLPSNHPQVVGSFGLHGTRYGNFTIQNADLVLSIGSRLDTHLTGSPITTFAREAKKIVVDIDLSELNKYKVVGMDMDILIHSDAKDFLQVIITKINGITKPDISEWKGRIAEWKTKYPICPSEYYKQEEVNPYVFVKALSKESSEGDVIIVDTGCALAWMMQAFEFKPNQRLVHDFNNTSMGYALPASIGACFALDGQQIICVIGDGSLQMSIQELATVVGHQLPIKIFLINNHGYSMIRQTQDQWLGSRYLASSIEGGLTFPDIV
ncbi:thiamine pyrophosphate-binding protein, partial [bacterium]|nr:thiamine pyrophosphate-binding protein [bacterium]